MKEETGATYQSSKYAKALVAADAKVGKTCFLVGQALGAFPNQKFGGVVDKASHLHVLTFDAAALTGVNLFLRKSCGKGEEYLKYRVYNHQDEFKKVALERTDWNYDLYNSVVASLQKVTERAKAEGGVHVLIFSSLTGLAEGILRAIAGPPDPKKKGQGMDPAKWSEFARQLVDIRNFAQVDSHHTLWEAHVDRGPQFSMKKNDNEDEGAKESIHVPGQAGRNWSFNVEQVFRIRREMGNTYNGTKVDRAFLDTRPSMDFIAGGRSFTELLEPREYDMTVAFHKLKLKVGQFGKKKSA